jgi:hypothetical protein
VSKRTPESEHRFRRYLEENGYTWKQLDDGSHSGPTPDYRVERDGVAAIVEVKEFTTTQLSRRLAALGPGGTSIGDDESAGPVRSKINAGARQLKPWADSGLPLVILLVNPWGIYLPLASEDLQIAMYGNMVARVPFNQETEELTGPVRLELDRNGALTNRHPFVGAVAVLLLWLPPHRSMAEDLDHFHLRTSRIQEVTLPEGSRFFVDVVETIRAHGGQAASIPDALFDGPRDRLWRVDQRARAYRLARQGGAWEAPFLL